MKKYIFYIILMFFLLPFMKVEATEQYDCQSTCEQTYALAKPATKEYYSGWYTTYETLPTAPLSIVSVSQKDPTCQDLDGYDSVNFMFDLNSGPRCVGHKDDEIIKKDVCPKNHKKSDGKCYTLKKGQASCPKGYSLVAETGDGNAAQYTCKKVTTTNKCKLTDKYVAHYEYSFEPECSQTFHGHYIDDIAKCNVNHTSYPNTSNGCCKYYVKDGKKQDCFKITKEEYDSQKVNCKKNYTRTKPNDSKKVKCYKKPSNKEETIKFEDEIVNVSYSCENSVFNYSNGKCESCPAGYIREGDQCVGSCPAGYIREGNICVGSCPAGYTRNGNSCYRTEWKNDLFNYVCREADYKLVGSILVGESSSKHFSFVNEPYCLKETSEKSCNFICDAKCPNGESNDDLKRCIKESVVNLNTYFAYNASNSYGVFGLQTIYQKIPFDYVYAKCASKYCDNTYSCTTQNVALQYGVHESNYRYCIDKYIDTFMNYNDAKDWCISSNIMCRPYCYQYNSKLDNLSCSLYDKSNTFNASDNINQSSYTSCTISQNRPSLYGKYITTFIQENINVNMYCREKASINLPGNVWNKQRTNSYFEWPASKGLNTMTSYLNYECGLFTEYENTSTDMTTNIADVLKYLSFETNATILTGLKNTSTYLNVDYIDINNNDIRKYFNKYENVINIGNNIYATNKLVNINSNLYNVQLFNIYVGYKYTLPLNYNRYYNKITGKIETVTNEFTYTRNKGNINITIDDKGKEKNKLKISTFKLGDITIENYTCKYDVGKSLVEECKCPSGTKNEYKSLPTSMGSCQYLISKYCDTAIPKEKNTCVGYCIKTKKEVESKNIRTYDKICDGKKCDLEFSCINAKKENGNIKVCVKNYLYKKYKINNYLNIGDDKLHQALKYCDKKTCNRKNDSIIYRVIDLKNPFPGMKGTGRISGSNWSHKDIRNKIINTNHKNVIYEITLTPNDIKKVREYNKKNSYNDFKMDCKSKDKASACLSKFLRENLNIQGKCKTITNENSFYECIK